VESGGKGGEEGFAIANVDYTTERGKLALQIEVSKDPKKVLDWGRGMCCGGVSRGKRYCERLS